MRFTTPEPFEEALKKLKNRKIALAPLRSSEWREKVPAALRDRAFFSSTLENARVAQAMKDFIADYLAKALDSATGGLKAQGRAEFVADMRDLCIREGLGKLDPETGRIADEIDEADLTDLRSMARLQLIFDTQTTAANEYGYWAQGSDPDLLYAYPAQRFIRIRPVRVPRPYHAANENAVRRKDDLDFWLSMNPDFGVPWGPWGFNSGMGVEDVDRIEAEDLGLLAPGEEISSPERKLNDHLSAGIRDLDPDIRAELRQIFGSQIRESNDRMEWSGQNATGPIPRNPIGGIASMEQAKSRFHKDLGVSTILEKVKEWKTWGKELPEVERIGLLRTVYSEFKRMVEKYPAIAGKLAEFAATDNERGLAHIGGPRMATKHKPWSKSSWEAIRLWEKENGRKWGTEREDSQVADNFRHELGHTLTTQQILSDWRKGPMQRGKTWFAQNISDYASGRNGGSFEYESLAECFSIFTRSDYDGSLPEDIETIMQQMLQ